MGVQRSVSSKLCITMCECQCLHSADDVKLRINAYVNRCNDMGHEDK